MYVVIYLREWYIIFTNADIEKQVQHTQTTKDCNRAVYRLDEI
jgi:hypothetical protein